MAVQVIPELPFHELAARLALAGACGAVVGFEREWRDRTAGFRTHILVCVGAAVFTLISGYGFSEWYQNSASAVRPNVMNDPSRIAAQIVSGIGFLGAGAIFQSRGSVKGLTTAASLWAMAAIGMAVGAGEYRIALSCTVLIVFVLTGLRQFSRRIKTVGRQERAAIELQLRTERAMGAVFDALRVLDARVVRLTTAKDEHGEFRRHLTLDLDIPRGSHATTIVDHLAEIDGVALVALEDVDDA